MGHLGDDICNTSWVIWETILPANHSTAAKYPVFPTNQLASN